MSVSYTCLMAAVYVSVSFSHWWEYYWSSLFVTGLLLFSIHIHSDTLLYLYTKTHTHTHTHIHTQLTFLLRVLLGFFCLDLLLTNFYTKHFYWFQTNLFGAVNVTLTSKVWPRFTHSWCIKILISFDNVLFSYCPLLYTVFAKHIE